MMRSTLAAAAAALVAVAAPAMAAPASYSMTFTNTVTTGAQAATPSGSFTYDPATETFSDFKVAIRGVTIDLTADANAGALNLDSCSANKTVFDILAGTTDCASNQIWYFLDTEFGQTLFLFASVDPLIADTAFMVFGGVLDSDAASNTFQGDGPDDGGTFEIAARNDPAPLPVPASIALIGLGLAGLAATRRRASGCGG